MAHVSGVAEGDLREALTDAHETILYLADALGCEPHEQTMLDEAKELRQAAELYEQQAHDAENRLEELLAEDTREELERVRTELTETIKQRDELADRLAEAQSAPMTETRLVEDYSDMLAMARRFVSAGEAMGLRSRHVRAAKPIAKPRKRKAAP